MDFDFLAWPFYFLGRVFGKFVALAPSVSKESDNLVARSSVLGQILCLGFSGRKVTVDPALKIVRIRYRFLWLVPRSRRIEFEWIERVLYSFNTIGEEVFSVGFHLKNGDELTLFRFIGQPGFINYSIYPDWMSWPTDKFEDLTTGPQDGLSLMYAEAVSRLIGVPLENPTP